jgi:predicted SAM-dependent methyltransferase
MARVSRVAAYDRTVLKDIAKRMLRPLTLRLGARVDARIQSVRRDLADVSDRIQPIQADLEGLNKHLGPIVARVQTHDRLTRCHEETITKLDEQVTAINRYLPGVLNSISSQNAALREARRTENDVRDHLTAQRDALAHAQKRIDELAEALLEQQSRTEFIRREILFETRYGAQRDRGFVAEIQPQIVANKKVIASGTDIHLNLGCGHLPIDGYLNVDGRELPGVDIVAEVGDLPFDPGTVSQIHSAHLLEHFPIEELSRRLLPYWFELLRPGGRFTAVVPDAETMLLEYSAGRLTFDELRLVTFGEQEYAGDFHFNMFSHSSLRNLLSEVGFVNVEMVEMGRRNGVCYEMEIAAERPESDV